MYVCVYVCSLMRTILHLLGGPLADCERAAACENCRLLVPATSLPWCRILVASVWTNLACFSPSTSTFDLSPQLGGLIALALRRIFTFSHSLWRPPRYSLGDPFAERLLFYLSSGAHISQLSGVSEFDLSRPRRIYYQYINFFLLLFLLDILALL